MAAQCDAKNWGAIECQCLQAHNQYRQQHNAPPLTISKELNQIATKWAKKLAAKGQMEHSAGKKYGENLYVCSGYVQVTGDMAVKAWYDEIQFYDFSKAEFTPNTGHFTQLVWRDTKQVGIGYAKKGKKFFVVCNYFPPGNVIGRFRENVLPKN